MGQGGEASANAEVIAGVAGSFQGDRSEPNDATFGSIASDNLLTLSLEENPITGAKDRGRHGADLIHIYQMRRL